VRRPAAAFQNDGRNAIKFTEDEWIPAPFKADESGRKGPNENPGYNAEWNSDECTNHHSRNRGNTHQFAGVVQKNIVITAINVKSIILVFSKSLATSHHRNRDNKHGQSCVLNSLSLSLVELDAC
jgi:hypothetical protein